MTAKSSPTKNQNKPSGWFCMINKSKAKKKHTQIWQRKIPNELQKTRSMIMNSVENNYQVFIRNDNVGFFSIYCKSPHFSSIEHSTGCWTCFTQKLLSRHTSVSLHSVFVQCVLLHTKQAASAIVGHPKSINTPYANAVRFIL